MEKSKDLDEIKEIFSKIPSELDMENSPAAKIESKTFEQIFAPLSQL